MSARVAVACPSREIREIRRCRNVAGSAAGGVGIVTKAPGYPPALPIDHTSVCLVDGQRTRDAAEVQSEKKKRFVTSVSYALRKADFAARGSGGMGGTVHNCAARSWSQLFRKLLPALEFRQGSGLQSC